MPTSPGEGTLREIGKLPLINSFADPELRPNNPDPNSTSRTFGQFRQRLMRPIDIFPVKFQVDLGKLGDALAETLPTCSEKPVIVDFMRGITEYNLKLAAIRLCDKLTFGLRVWVNNETTSTDGVQNNYKQNKIVEGFNNLIDSASKGNEFLRSIGAITDPMQQNPQNPFAAALLDSRHLSLPKIWESSDYNPQLDLTVKLISPYGNKNSFKKNIAKPLLYLTALGAPSTYDGVTYGQPSHMYIRAYGTAFMPLAYMDSIQIVRGGTNARVNWDKQPLEVSVSMSFKSAMPGFAAFLPPNTFNLDTGISFLNNIINFGLTYGSTCGGVGCTDPIGTVPDLDNNDAEQDANTIIASEGKLNIPGVTSLGNIIQSLRPTYTDIRSTPPSLLDNYQNTTPAPVGPNYTQSLEQIINRSANILQESGIQISSDEYSNMIGYDSNQIEQAVSTV